MYCVVWKNNSDLYTMFTNTIFETEKKAIEFKDKQNLCVKNMIAELSNMNINTLTKLDGDR